MADTLGLEPSVARRAGSSPVPSTMICTKCNKEKNNWVDKHCPKCDSCPKDHTVDQDPLWRDGPITCSLCGEYVRFYDPG